MRDHCAFADDDHFYLFLFVNNGRLSAGDGKALSERAREEEEGERGMKAPN